MSIEPDRLISRSLKVRWRCAWIAACAQPAWKSTLAKARCVSRWRCSSKPPARRREPLDHTLIFGPPGLGKTTMAHIVAAEMGVAIKSTSGPVLERAGDLAALLTNLEDGDVLFVDEIHRLSPVVEEILYPAMEDFQIDILIGEGPAAAPSNWTCRASPWSAPPLVPAC